MGDIEYWRANYSDNVDELEALVAPLRRGVASNNLDLPESCMQLKKSCDVLLMLKRALGWRCACFAIEQRVLNTR